jgi:hypothetical protein
MAGRPTDYTQEMADIICNRVANGESLNTICNEENLPCRMTIYRWLRAHSEFSDNYARAREDQADWFADQIVEIADTEPDANIARVRIDARKWVASKLKSKNYGDKAQMELTGKDGAPITPVINVSIGPESSSSSEAG